MDEKQFKKLKRIELVEIISQLDDELELAKKENLRLSEQLASTQKELDYLISVNEAVEKLEKLHNKEEKVVLPDAVKDDIPAVRESSFSSQTETEKTATETTATDSKYDPAEYRRRLIEQWRNKKADTNIKR